MSRNDDFSVEIVDAAGTSGGIGRIRAGRLFERFSMSFGRWEPADYRRSWQDSFNVLLSSTSAVSCLVSSMHDPETSNFIACWPLYREGDVVHVQNRMLLLEQLEHPFDARAPWLSMSPRATVGQGGDRISEWDVSFEAVRQFFESAG